MSNQTERLKKLLQVTLVGEGFEAFAALRAIRRYMQREQMDAYDLLAMLNAPQLAPVEPIVFNDWAEQISFLMEHQGWLNDRELEFLLDVDRKHNDAGWRWTPRRLRYLQDIYLRVQITSSLNQV